MSRIRADKLVNRVATGAPQLTYGAEIPVGYGITGAGNISITGVITATTLYGDGSGLTGVVGSGSGVIIRDGGSLVGTAGTINFGDNLTVSPISVGIVTVSVNVLSNIQVTGIATFDQVTTTGFSTLGAVSATLLNISGVSTLSGGINASQGVDATGLRVTGITTLGQANITGLSNAGISTLGDATATTLVVSGVSTLSGGISVTSGGVNVTGVITATSFSGDGSGLTGVGATDNVSTSTLVNSGVSTLSGGVNASQGVDATGLRVTGITTLGQTNITGLSNAGISTLGDATATTLVVSGVSTVGIVTGATYFGDASYIVSGKWTLGADGSNDYTFTGIGFTQTTNDPALYLARGAVYEFVNNMGAHPFRIQSTPNGSTGTQYNDGVTNNDVSNGTLRFEIPFNAPNTLYYQCTAHAGMGGTITVYPSI